MPYDSHKQQLRDNKQPKTKHCNSYDALNTQKFSSSCGCLADVRTAYRGQEQCNGAGAAAHAVSTAPLSDIRSPLGAASVVPGQQGLRGSATGQERPIKGGSVAVIPADKQAAPQVHLPLQRCWRRLSPPTPRYINIHACCAVFQLSRWKSQ